MKFCCVSGGCLPGVFLASGLDIHTVWKQCFLPWIHNMNSISSHGALLSTFTDESMAVLLKNIRTLVHNEKDMLHRINERLEIRITQIKLFDGELFKRKQFYISSWESLEDLIECVASSCWLPGLFGKLTKSYRNMDTSDGGFPKTIECRGPKWLHIKINTFQNMTPENKQLLYLSSLSTVGNVHIVQELYDLGYKDRQ